MAFTAAALLMERQATTGYSLHNVSTDEEGVERVFNK